MKKKSIHLILPALALLLFVQCQSLFDESYERPSWLEAPIYDILKEDGRFTSYLQCVDSTLYARILKSASNYTVLAPTDEAFDRYLQESGRLVFTGNSKADTLQARKNALAKLTAAEADTIVAYSMLFNTFEFDELTDVLTKGWDTLSSIRKKTAFYETLHREVYNGDSVWVIDATSENTAIIGENNYKFVPTYMSRMFSKRGLSSVDYESFYNREYTGSNIQNASVVTKDMFAENGIVHAVDRVNKPLPNLEQLIGSDSTLSMFREMLDLSADNGQKAFKSFITTDNLTNYYKELFPERNIDKVYVKFYTGLPVSPNTEKVGYTDKLCESSGFSLVVPSNKAINEFFKEKIKPFVTRRTSAGLTAMPVDYWKYFLYSHMSADLIWPSRFRDAQNVNSEFYNGLGSTGKGFDEMPFKQVKVASNGFFYQLEDTSYIHPKQFETVIAQLLLDPDYSWMAAAMKQYYGSSLMEELMRSPLNGYSSEYYIVFLMSNTALTRNGYSVTIDEDGVYTFNNNDCSTGLLTAEERLKRLIRSCVFVRIRNAQMNNTLENLLNLGATAAPTNCYKNYGYEVAVNYYGDMVKILCPSGAASSKPKKLQIQMLGRYDYGPSSYIVASRMVDIPFNNGMVYTLGANDLLDYCNSPSTWDEKPLGYYLLDKACVDNSNLSTYKQYAEKVLFSATTTGYTMPEEILISDQLTILAPNNAAMLKAQNDGYLPPLASLTTQENITKARKFLLHHMLNGRVLVNDMDTTKSNGSGVIYDYKASTFVTTLTCPSYLTDGRNTMLVDVTKAADGCLQFQTSPTVSTVTNGVPVKISLSTQANNKKMSNLYGRRCVIHEINGYLPCTPIKQ